MLFDQIYNDEYHPTKRIRDYCMNGDTSLINELMDIKKDLEKKLPCNLQNDFEKFNDKWELICSSLNKHSYTYGVATGMKMATEADEIINIKSVVKGEL